MPASAGDPRAGQSRAPRPLPFRPRPVTGESTSSYVRRLARANHLRPAYLRRYLADPQNGTIRIDLLAALEGRSPAVLEYALADLGRQQGRHPHRGPRASPDRIAARTAIFAAIRSDAELGMSYRALADRHGVHRRTVLQALRSPVPAPRKPMPEVRILAEVDDVVGDVLGRPKDAESGRGRRGRGSRRRGRPPRRGWSRRTPPPWRGRTGSGARAARAGGAAR